MKEQAQSELKIENQTFHYYQLAKVASTAALSRLPYSIKILLENLVRHWDEEIVHEADIQALTNWDPKAPAHEIAYVPARVILQDFTGVPAIVDLAAMRDAMQLLGGNPNKINPLSPVDLVIDHSVMVDAFGNKTAFQENVQLEYDRNQERYTFLRWGQKALQNFRVVPPGTGIVHQVNLEYLAPVVFQQERSGQKWLYPDTLVGTDSHTTMINGLGVLGWGVGGIEAEAAMLGQPVTMLIPEVIGVKLTGKMRPGTTATDLVLTITKRLRARGVVEKFVEFFGPSLKELPLADRATIANMAPEYGATCGIFPIDEETLNFLKLTGRSDEQVEIVRHYAKAQHMFADEHTPPADYTDVLEVNLDDIEPALAGPRRPQDQVLLKESKTRFNEEIALLKKDAKTAPKSEAVKVHAQTAYDLTPGAVVIAAITSCTNTSNPAVMVAAGLVAQKAVARGLHTKPWVKTSLAPGSQVVSDYLQKSNLMPALEALGFNLVGYGCTTCIGNSGPLPTEVANAITEGNLPVCAVLSGNRNFEGRIHPQVRLAYLASPPLVVAYALTGTMNIDFEKEPIGFDQQQKPVYLKEIWPSKQEIEAAMHASISPDLFRKRYATVFEGSDLWRTLPTPTGERYTWVSDSTYIQNPPYFKGMSKTPSDIRPIQNARVLAVLGDSITTDHISPAGSIGPDTPAGKFLLEHGVKKADFNSYGSRRGNHEVMMRGTFANVRLRNKMVPEVEGGFTKHLPSNEVMSIYDASMKYQSDNTPLVILAGKEYGSGSSRDWAAKGTALLGVRAVIAQSFERIHRSNLIGMGILPLTFANHDSVESLKLTGQEVLTIDLSHLKPRGELNVQVNGSATTQFQVRVGIDTPKELEYFRHGGILHYVLRQLAQQSF